MDKQKALEMFDELEDLLYKDIKSVVAKNDITPPDYQCLDTTIDIYKDIETIKAMINSGFGEYEVSGMMSGRMVPSSNMSMNSYDYGGNSGYWPQHHYDTYNDGYSGARGRSSITGRYVSRDDEMTAKLNNMMQTAGTEQERQIISRMMNELGR